MEQTATETVEFKNDLVQVALQRKPGCKMEFQVTASPKLVEAARKKAVKIIAKEVSLPGFRKGKAPDYLVLKNYPQQVDKEWESAIADAAFQEGQKLAKVPLLSNNPKISFQMKSHSLEQGAELLLLVETEPLVPPIDPKQITLQAVKRPEVNEEKVEEIVRQTQLFFAEWNIVEERAAQEGDFVLLNIDIIEDAPPTPLFSQTRFEVTDKSMAQWMRNLVIGLKPGESKEGISEPDEDLSEEEKKDFPPKKVRLHLLIIEKPNMPALDDAFAQKLGVPSLEKLRPAMEHLLNKQADAHVQEKLREQLSDYLLKNCVFDLPPSLIEKELRLRFEQLFQDGDFLKFWNGTSADEKKNFVETMQQLSEKAVRMFYICRKILTDAHISISPQDLPKGPSTPLEALIMPQSQGQQLPQPELRQAEAISKIMLEKAEDYLISSANISPLA